MLRPPSGPCCGGMSVSLIRGANRQKLNERAKYAAMTVLHGLVQAVADTIGRKNLSTLQIVIQS